MNASDKGPWFCDANAGVPALPEVVDEFIRVEQQFPPAVVVVVALIRRGDMIAEDVRHDDRRF